MEDLSRLCMVCMSLKDENDVCPNCKNSSAVLQEAPFLPLGHIMGERYCIGKAVKQNGEGITYPAYDLKLNKAVSVREFYPDSIAYRADDEITVLPAGGSEAAFSDSLTSFLELWAKLMRLKGLSALISIYDIVETNGTAYAVYDECERFTLRDFLLKTDAGYIPWEQARILFMPILSTLGTLHTSGVIHRGISPEAFIFSADGRLKITDFSITEARTVFGDITPEIIDGYAPIEQYTDDKPQGSWTDIYAFAAVLYRTLIGTTPINAQVRARNDQMMIPAKFAEQLPPYVINALINAMQIDADDRTRNVEQLRSNLSASPRAVSASASVYAETPLPRSVQSPNPQTPPVRKAPVRPAQTPATVQTVRQTENYKPERYSENAEALLAATKKAKSKRTLTVLLVILLIAVLTGIVLIGTALISMSRDNETTTLSASETACVVPSFLGQSYDAIAANAAYTSNFHIIKVDQYSVTVAKGMVISQSLAAQTQAAKGSDIVLYVSAGPNTFTVPDVTGLTYEEACQILASKGLLCSKATKYNDGTHAANTVAETFPAVNTQIKEGDSISIILWTSPETNTTSVPATTETPTSSSSGGFTFSF